MSTLVSGKMTKSFSKTFLCLTAHFLLGFRSISYPFFPFFFSFYDNHAEKKKRRKNIESLQEYKCVTRIRVEGCKEEGWMNLRNTR